MRRDLQQKIGRAIRLIQSAAKGYDSPIEVAYSGGKDSDVILQLAKEADINYRAIYKATTIDPPGTIRHVKEMGAEILMPKNKLTFFKLLEKNGLPTMRYRFCCRILKEYKVLDRVIVGIRREESVNRRKRYTEPTACRIYSKRDHVEQFYPILDWTTQDVKEYLEDRGIFCASVYYGGYSIQRKDLAVCVVRCNPTSVA